MRPKRSEMPTTTGCVCSGPDGGEGVFVCERHGCRKSLRAFHLCRTSAAHFEAGEAGRLLEQAEAKKSVENGSDPTQPQQRKLLGDRVEAALKRVGITQERVGALLGQEGGCGGCAWRKRKLNELHLWAEKFADKSIEVARDALESLFKKKEKPRRPKAKKKRAGKSRSRRRRGKARST